MPSVLFSFRNEQFYAHHTVTESPDPQSFPFQLHSHSMHELYYFVGGEAEYHIEGAVYPLQKGTLLLTPSGRLHHLKVAPSAPYERMVVMFAYQALPVGFEHLLANAAQGQHLFHLNEREQIFFEESFTCLKNADDGMKNTLLCALLPVILAKLSAARRGVLAESPQNETVQGLLRYINQNLTSPLDLSVLEREFFQNRSSLNRAFRQVMGCSIWEYVIQKRVFNARQQLYLTRSIGAAFAASGFRDYSVFYKNYLRCTGLPPSQDLRSFGEPAQSSPTKN